MKNNLSAETLTASLPHEAQALFAWIADPENLARWHTPFCRSLRRENGSLIIESPRGPVPVRFIRDDRSFVLDMLTEVTEGIELTNAIRILSNGDGSAMVWTLVQPDGVSDTVFQEQLRWAASALDQLRDIPLSVPVSVPGDIQKDVAASAEPAEPFQPSAPEAASSLPLSGRKLFIGNLSYAWSDDELRAHFAQQGNVTVAEVARFRGRGGRSRGFGFVEMATEAEAQTAIEKLHGGLAGGRELIVRLAKSQEKRQDKTHDGTESGEGTPEPVQRPRAQRPARGASPQRVPRRLPGSRVRSSGAPAAERPHRQDDITNKSGYEVFRRRPAGATGDPTPSEPPSPRSRSNVELSPYMEDTGDIENRGPRGPRHRRRR